MKTSFTLQVPNREVPPRLPGAEAEQAVALAPEIGAIATIAEARAEHLRPFELALDELAADVPEVAEKREAIKRGGAELIERFGIKPELFADKAHTLFFSALADRVENTESRKDAMTATEYDAEQEFITNATAMLALDKAEAYEHMKPHIDGEVQAADENETERILDKYTNKQVSADLQQAIDAGLLDHAQRKLGIKDGVKEDPYSIHVLNISGDDTPFNGMHPDTLGDQADEAVAKEARDDSTLFREYAQQLKKNGQEFLKETGRESIAPAWVETLKGRKHLVVPLPVAEKIVYTDEARSPDYTSVHAARDKAMLEHEYGHTQGGLLLDRKPYFGLMLEERRAEIVSGDKHGYEAVKGFLGLDMNVLKGAKIPELIESSSKEGEPDSFYPELANRIGLQPTLELALLAPKNYISDRRPAQKAVNEHIGGPDGYSRRLYNSDALLQATVSEKIENWAASVGDRDSARSWLAQRESLYGLNFVTGLLRDGLDRQSKVSQ